MDLRPWYQFATASEPVGEVWLTGDDCLVASGPFVGKTLGQLFDEAPETLLGTGVSNVGSPLLLKVIFAEQRLSVQVHPNDILAQKYGHPRGKTECWYVLASDPGGQVAVGLKPGLTMQQVRAGVENGTLERCMELLTVHRGDMIFVDAGTVHAIWPGSILLEAQQNCDLTYRLYDYGRPRELHVEKAIEATRLNTRAGKMNPKASGDRTVLVDAEYFRVERLLNAAVWRSSALPAEDEPEAGLSYLFAAEGEGRIAGKGFAPVDLPARGTVAVPAASPEFDVEDRGGLELIRVSPRWPAKTA